jgi:hypothetical protein
MMKKQLLFDRCLTGHLSQEAGALLKVYKFIELGYFLLFDCCLTGQFMAEALEKRIMGLLREVTE